MCQQTVLRFFMSLSKTFSDPILFIVINKMLKVLVLRFQQFLVPFTILLTVLVKRDVLDTRLTTPFEVYNFRNI